MMKLLHRLSSGCALATLLMACGGDTTSTPGAVSAPAPGAESGTGMPGGDVAEQAEEAVGAAVAETVSAEAAECLDLVGAGRFADAVPVCLRAKSIDPDDADVEQALETARSEAAEAEAARALGSSGEELDQAKEGVLGRLPE